MTKRVLCGLAVALSLSSDSAAAQATGWFGLGPVLRTDKLPLGFDSGIRVGMELGVHRKLTGPLQLAIGADGSIEQLDVSESRSDRPGSATEFSFNTVELGAGLGSSARRGGATISGSLQYAAVYGFWGSADVGSCGTNCTLVGDDPNDRMGEWRQGPVVRARVVWGVSDMGFGFEVRRSFISPGSKSHMPYGGLALLAVVGSTH